MTAKLEDGNYVIENPNSITIYDLVGQFLLLVGRVMNDVIDYIVEGHSGINRSIYLKDSHLHLFTHTAHVTFLRFRVWKQSICLADRAPVGFEPMSNAFVRPHIGGNFRAYQAFNFLIRRFNVTSPLPNLTEMIDEIKHLIQFSPIEFGPFLAMLIIRIIMVSFSSSLIVMVNHV